MKRIAILGSTGSIGRQTLGVVRAFPGEFSVVGLSAWSNTDLLLEQAWELRPALVWCKTPLPPEALPPGCRMAEGPTEIATDPSVEMVVQGLVGNVGLTPTLEALRAGKQVALANKEPVVMAGDLLAREVKRSGGQLLPVDSEPSAIWQCLRGEDPVRGVRRLIITASGGAFRGMPLEAMASVTPEDALKHPTWSMGSKVTIDSATMMNKVFEVIEARWLFDMPWERLDVVIHPQSIIHSMVEFDDNSVKAQLGPPDMRLPIQHALFYPRRLVNSELPRLDPVAVGALTFEAMDPERYPCFQLGREAARAGGAAPTVLSAADEAAVELFLDRRIGFLDIPKLISRALDSDDSGSNPTIEQLFAADARARETVRREAKRS